MVTRGEDVTGAGAGRGVVDVASEVGACANVCHSASGAERTGAGSGGVEAEGDGAATGGATLGGAITGDGEAAAGLAVVSSGGGSGIDAMEACEVGASVGCVTRAKGSLGRGSV